MIRTLTKSLRSFRHTADGSVSVEAAFYLPLMLGIFAATYTLFDLFRQELVNTKAAYTISDLISRETSALNDDYIDSMYDMTKLLIRSDSGMSMRISIVYWDEEDSRYYVDWSVERGANLAVLDNNSVKNYKDDLPSIPDQERVIVVETWNDIEPAFNIGLGTRNLYNFVFTRPRFSNQVVFGGEIFSDGAVHDDDFDDTVVDEGDGANDGEDDPNRGL